MHTLRSATLVFLTLGVAVVAVTGSIGAATTSPASPGPPLARPSDSLTASDVVTRVVATRQGINSYSVPIHFNLVVHKGVSVSAQLDAVRYFQRPDKDMLVMRSMPSFARKFRNIYSGVGTPETWLEQYDVTFAEDPVSDSQSYKLKSVPKGPSSVGISYVLLDVARDTFAPISAHVFYSNGGTVALQFENGAVNGIYRLTALETIDIAFPDYKVHAVAHYGAYQINTPIPESIWQSSPQPLPT